ncbi:MAG: hypothetical protein ACXAEF_01925 [Candidatus Thorarchaeota archaeon]|jgi:hypothetical protein
MAYKEPNPFNPPEVGLHHDETVVWEKKAGITTSIWFCGGCLPLLMPFIVPLSFAYLGSSVGIGVLFFCVLGIMYFAYTYLKIRRTRYYLTTKRIIEVRGGDIQQELPLESFSGKPLDDYFQVKEDYRSGANTFHTVRIYDLKAEILIELKGMVEDDVERLKEIASS